MYILQTILVCVIYVQSSSNIVELREIVWTVAAYYVFSHIDRHHLSTLSTFQLHVSLELVCVINQTNC